MISGKTSTSRIQHFLESGLIPSVAYILGVANNDAHMLSDSTAQIPYFSTHPVSYPLPEAANLGINIGWNGATGITAFVLGLYQIRYNKGPSDITKGFFNILNGLQLVAFTYNPWITPNNLEAAGPTALALPALALAMTLDFINAVIDTIAAYWETRVLAKAKEHSEPSDSIRQTPVKTENLQTEYDAKKLNLLMKGFSWLGMVSLAVPTLMKWLGNDASIIAHVTSFANLIGAVITTGIAACYMYHSIFKRINCQVDCSHLSPSPSTSRCSSPF